MLAFCLEPWAVEIRLAAAMAAKRGVASTCVWPVRDVEAFPMAAPH